MNLASRAAAAIEAHARATSPAECCGLLIGDEHHIELAMPAANLSADPGRRFLIDPRDHLAAIRAARSRGRAVIGAYHSHPQGRARPSPTDAAEAFGDFLYLIVGLATEPADIRAWRWADGNFTEVPLVRVPEGLG